MASQDSYEHDILEVSVKLIENYEKKRWGKGFPDPIAAIQFFITQKDKDLKDLGRLLDSTKVGSKILQKEIPLTIPMLYKLCTQWEIPVECLVLLYEIKA